MVSSDKIGRTLDGFVGQNPSDSGVTRVTPDLCMKSLSVS